MSETPPGPLLSPRPRLLSLDALRGLDMLCIAGLDDIVREIHRLGDNTLTATLAEQFEHVPWAGLHAYDLVFPLFMFLSGVSLPLSLDGRTERGTVEGKPWGKVLLRCALLILLGMVYNGVFSEKPAEPRFASVLGQIGIAWGITAAIHLTVTRVRARQGILFGWLAGIALLQLVVPVPGHGAGVLTETGAINAWFDRLFLPGRLHGGTFDPEGLLSVLFAVPLTLAGALAGSYLKREQGKPFRFAGRLAAAGAACILCGVICWNLGYPPVKALWTATFDLLAIGVSAILFAVFFAVIDGFRWERWSFPLRVVGMNSLTIYLGARLISFPAISTLLFGRAAVAAEEMGPLLLLSGVLLLQWLVLWFFCRKKWFLRV